MNRNIKTLTGRSMTEMLGVLAIIGVLSIGGVAAYRKAMDTKKINDIIYDMSLLGTLVAHRNHTYFNEPCTTFAETAFAIPSYFDTCTATSGQNDLAVFTVTYNTQLPERIVNALADRCSHGVYISADAKQFVVGPHGWDCVMNEADLSPTPPQCTSDSDCGTSGMECHKGVCKHCYEYTKISDVSSYCCAQLASWDYSVQWTDGKCAYTGEEACAEDSVMSIETWCTCQSDIQIVLPDTRQTICCAASHGTPKKCCEDLGKIWDEKQGLCLSTANDSLCTAHEKVDNCECLLTIPVYGPNGQETYCCSPQSDKSCCEAMGFTWSNITDPYDGYCSVTPDPEEMTCIKVLGYSYSGGEVH